MVLRKTKGKEMLTAEQKALVTDEEFAKWVGTQPDDRTFRYFCTKTCAMACFMREHVGTPHVIAGGVTVRVTNLVGREETVFIPWKTRQMLGQQGSQFTIATLKRHIVQW